MKNIQYTNITGLENEYNENFTDICFDGCKYYLTYSGIKAVLIIDVDNKIKKYINTKRAYSKLCYDSNENCFWASSNFCLGRIYKLNENLFEIDCIKIDFCDLYKGVISNITFDCNKNCVILVVGNNVLSYSKKSERFKMLLANIKGCITGVLSIAPVFLVSVIDGETQYLCVFSGDGSCLNMMKLPQKYIVNSMILSCESLVKYPNLKISLLTLKNNNYSYLCSFVINPIEDLKEIPCRCIYEKCNSLISDCKCKNTNLCCGGDAMPCNCNCCDYNICCDKDCCYDVECSEVIASIACVEMSIADILRAEAQKIEKVLECTDDIQTILEVNEQVKDTVVKATHLEQVLFDKLSQIKNICKFKKNKN